MVINRNDLTPLHRDTWTEAEIRSEHFQRLPSQMVEWVWGSCQSLQRVPEQTVLILIEILVTFQNQMVLFNKHTLNIYYVPKMHILKESTHCLKREIISMQYFSTKAVMSNCRYKLTKVVLCPEASMCTVSKCVKYGQKQYSKLGQM